MRFRHVVDLLDHMSVSRRDSPAIADPTSEWSYSELARFSKKFARWLIYNNVAAGDRVVVQSVPNSKLAAVAYGCFRAGAVFVPVAHSATQYQLDRIVQDAQAKLVITDKAFDNDARYRSLCGIWNEVCGLKEYAAGRELHSSDIALLMYTSGSTSSPKGVISPHGAVLFAVLAIADRLAYSSEDVVGCRLSFAFDYGLYQLFLCALAGAKLVLFDSSSDLSLASVLARQGVTVVPLVPSLASLILATAKRFEAADGVRLFTSTGEAMSPETLAKLRSTFPRARIRLMYGITECKRVSIMEADGDFMKPGSVGRPLAGTRVRIIDPIGVDVDCGVVGEIVVSGPHVMGGYWGDPDLTAAHFRLNSSSGLIELHTGDYGSIDTDGYLYFHGRSRDFFKRHGVRISSSEIECAANQIPGVSAAVVIPPTSEKDMVLCVVANILPHEILLELSKMLDPPRVPKSCYVMERFPLTTNGKIDRTLIAAHVAKLEGGVD